MTLQLFTLTFKNKSISMSYLIDTKNTALFNTEIIQKSNIQKINKQIRQTENIIKIDPLTIISSAFSKCHFIGLQNRGTLTLKFGQKYVFEDFSTIYQIKLSKNKDKICCLLHPLTPNNNYLKVETKQRRMIACKYLTKVQSGFGILTVSICSQNGRIKISMPQFDILAESIRNSQVMIKKCKEIFKLAEFQAKQNQQFFHFLRELANIDEYYNKKLQITNHILELKSKKIFLYSKMMSTCISIDEQSQIVQENCIMQKNIKQKQSLVKLMENFIEIGKYTLKPNCLYILNNQTIDKVINSDLKLKQVHRIEISRKIRVPFKSDVKNPYENFYLLNNIIIKNEQMHLNYPIKKGGFSSIYLVELQFWYVMSPTFQLITAQRFQTFNQNNKISKRLLVKREQRLNHRSRINHQKQILRQIKNGKSLLFPKYYVPVFNEQYKNDLLIDFINYPTIGEYVNYCRQTISIQTKLHLAYFITQALRYLRNYNIVHLDCKPANILIYKNLLIKLIDFGESYHPNVCTKDFKPGFTIPYSAPQIYHLSDEFSEKNDVFSIGVILHQLLFSKLPFFPFSDYTVYRYYNDVAYAHYWFQVPEDIYRFGDNRMIKVLHLLIGKCFNQNPKDRPQLDWITIILRQCLEYFF